MGGPEVERFLSSLAVQGRVARELGWQYLFPSNQRSNDPRDGATRRHHLDDSVLARALKRARDANARKADKTG